MGILEPDQQQERPLVVLLQKLQGAVDGPGAALLARIGEHAQRHLLRRSGNTPSASRA